MSMVRDWKFCQNSICRDRQQVSGLRDPSFSRQWLQQFKGDPGGMFSLRALLSQEDRKLDRFRMSDDDVLNQVAKLLASGRLHVHAQASRSGGGSAGASEPETSAPFPLGERRKWRPEPRQPEVTDPSTFSDGLDGQAQSAALLSAAAQGVPFCPESGETSGGGRRRGGVIMGQSASSFLWRGSGPLT